MFGIYQQERGGKSHRNDLSDVYFDAMIVSDQRAEYGDIGEDGYFHCTVSHKDHFVNPDTWFIRRESNHFGPPARDGFPKGNPKTNVSVNPISRNGAGAPITEKASSGSRSMSFSKSLI
jgi:hypothetical protein